MEPLLTTATAAPAQDLEKLDKAHRSGANWFYWIAALSLVNTVIQMMGSDRSFIVGLGITQVIDAITKGIADGAAESGSSAIATGLRVVGLGVDALVFGAFVLFGWFAGKRHGWAFGLGMVLYVLDALLFLVLQDWFSFGFHAFALFGLWTGFAALRKLREAEVRAGLAPIAPAA